VKAYAVVRSDRAMAGTVLVVLHALAAAGVQEVEAAGGGAADDGVGLHR
jgi:hypothetical protein